MLPPKRFDVCRYEWLKADGYGKVCMDGKHFYSTRPENANKQVLVGIRAHTVDILTEVGQVVTTHRRAYGDNRTDISDYSTTLAVLMKNSGAWGNSGLRRETPDALRAYMDAQPKEKLKDCLRIMNELTSQYGFQAAASAMEMAYVPEGRRRCFMMTPKMKEDFCTQILGASRQLFLSGRISEICREKGTQKQLEFLLELLQAELTLRDENRRKRLIKRAGFPTYKTFEGYSYHCVKFPPAFSREELETLEFVPGKKNLVLYGPVGIGKTHMAIAAGVKACNLGYKTKFYTVTELVLKLAESRKNGTLERLLRDLRSLDLLILDEWGYVPVDKDGSQLLFRVISDSYESKSLILTTNLEFSKWGGIFTDDQMAAAMIDRLVHHGHLLIFEGKSYRMEHALMRRDA